MLLVSLTIAIVRSMLIYSDEAGMRIMRSGQSLPRQSELGDEIPFVARMKKKHEENFAL